MEIERRCLCCKNNRTEGKKSAGEKIKMTLRVLNERFDRLSAFTKLVKDI